MPLKGIRGVFKLLSVYFNISISIILTYDNQNSLHPSFHGLWTITNMLEARLRE